MITAHRPRSAPLVRAVATLSLVVVSACSHGRGPDAQPTAPASAQPSATAGPSTPAPPLTGEQADKLTSGLASGTDDGVRSVIAMPSGQQIDPNAAQQLASLGPITFDLSTFQLLDTRYATVTGHVAHPPAGVTSTWTFTLVYDGSEWKLVDGEPQQ